MQKVYAMFGEGYLLGIFSSMKKANDAKEWLTEVDTHYKAHPEDLEIVPYELNGERLEVKRK